jgi:hypothetical protein
MSCDDRPVDVLTRLTALPEKAEHYAAEVWFREAWADVVELAGQGAQPLVHESAAIVFKPDGVVCDVIEAALEYLASRGFTPLVAHPVRLDRHVTRWLWLYRFNVASVERVRLHDLIHEAGDSILVLLRDERARGRPIPGTVRLTAAKGSSRPERRTGDQLRTHLRNEDRILNFLHTSDEPADLVRELGILLDRPARRRLLRQVLDREQFTLPAIAERSGDGPRELKLASALIRLQATFGRSGASSADQAIARLARAAAAGAEGSLRELWSLLNGHPHVDRWDAAVVGAHAIDYDEPGIERQTLGDASVELWVEHAASAHRCLVRARTF